jgi:SH3-like domain-containing protein
MFGYSLDGSDWEIVLIGLDTFGLSAVLSSTEPAAAGLPNGFGVTPVPQAVYPDGRIAFTLVRGGTDGSGGFEAYTWDPAVGAVGSTGGFGEIDLDTFDPTGESVMSGMDARFPATAVDALPFGQTNVLSYYSNATDLTTPFYTDPVLTFSNPTFVMNGSYVVVNAYDGVNEPEYRLIDRDGLRLGTLAIAPAPYDVAGTRDGFLYLQRIGATPALFSVNLRDGAIDIGETDSALFIGTDNTAPQVMWVGHTDPINPYFSVESAYTRWQDLATGTGGSAPTTPTDAVLTVGGEATIRTTEGDALNVRSGPGIGFAIVLKAQPGTVVTLQEGPTAADGFTWWRIRLPDGSEGWAVQEAENEQTLVPGAGSYTPDVPSGANPSVGSALTIGDFAYVSVSGRIDALRLRNAPTTSGGVIVLMPNLTPVTVIGGPATADGFTWWELRTAEGNVGWAAEVIGSERVLVKGLPFNAAATPVPSGDGGGQPQPATTPES